MQDFPLTGIRVLACDFAWAGPFNTWLLANLGAEVIKVEHHLARSAGRGRTPRARAEVNKAEGRLPGSAGGRQYRPESTFDAVTLGQVYLDGDPGERPWNRSGYINQFARSKKSVVLDLSKPEGKELFLKLVKISDVVQDNYSTRVMINFGLDYPVLREVNPGIIMIRQPGFGVTGPYKEYVAGGCPTEIHGGLSFHMGYHDGEPMRPGTCVVDPWAGLGACCVVLAALWQRRRTGQGQFLDTGQCECVTTIVGDSVLGYQMKSKWPDRFGNRHSSMAPHGCYPCRGEDKWIAIAVACDEEWLALSRAMGNPAWTKEERFSNQLSRSQNQDEMDRRIGEWTAQHDHIALMHSLQSQGVAAGAALDQIEVMADPQCQERDYYIEVEHTETGILPYAAPPWKMSKVPLVDQRAPLLGEDNGYVLRELLGLSDQEIAGLQERRIISDHPLE